MLSIPYHTIKYLLRLLITELAIIAPSFFYFVLKNKDAKNQALINLP